MVNPQHIKLYHQLLIDVLKEAKVEYEKKLENDSKMPPYLAELIASHGNLDSALAAVLRELEMLLFFSLFATTEGLLRSHYNNLLDHHYADKFTNDLENMYVRIL